MNLITWKPERPKDAAAEKPANRSIWLMDKKNWSHDTEA
jgi:hypothetical protein